MKKILILLTLVLFMAACSSDSPTGSPYIDLPVTDGVVTSTSARKTGEIETTGDIDRYKMTLNDYNRDVQIKCTSETMRPDVDLLVNVYEMNSDGELIMVAGNHAPEDGMFPADIKINLFIDQPKELYVFVRDLLTATTARSGSPGKERSRSS